jgi:lysine-N-methylase
MYIPNYYHKFKCISSACRHNCCIGWEIDIDDDTLTKYKNVTGEFSERLKNNISEDETPHFILSQNERCPFLNDKNLCDIITTLGEKYLCQICNDHPRFVNVFSDRTETGLGLTCEEAARIIITETSPFRLISEDNNPESLTEQEQTFIEIREKIFTLLGDRSRDLHERFDDVMNYLGCNTDYLSEQDWAEILSDMEILDEEWKEHISLLSQFKEDGTFPLMAYETAFENIAVYFIFRHMAGALDDGCLNERCAFAVISTEIIYRICAVKFKNNPNFSIDDIVETARMYSSEIEYSEENTDHFLDVLFEII